jgi:putative FmdB family regulatory protein
MPIYEYECKKCGKVFEELQGFDDPPLKKCRECKGKLEKLISLSSFQLTGTGWYATDYAKGPGIPSQAQDQGNPAIDSNSTSDNSSTSDSNSTVAESGPSSASDTFKSIEKETKKAKSKKKK